MKNHDDVTQLKLLQPEKIKTTTKKAIAIITFAGILGSFSSYFFVLAVNLYAPGIAGIASVISYSINDILWNHGHGWTARVAADNILFWTLYFLLNIPIIYLTVRWFSRRFLIYSVYGLMINLLVSMIIANINSINGGFVDIDAINSIDNEGIRNTLLYSVTFLFAFIGGVTSGISVGLMFKVGACSMGLDPVVKYVSREKNINLAPVIMTIAAVSITLFVIIRASIPVGEFDADNNLVGELKPAPITNKDTVLTSTIMSPEYIGSWLFIITYSQTVDRIFSSAKKVQIVATSDKSDKISDYLNSSSYHRGHTILTMEGGYSHEKKKAIKMIVNYQEMYDVVEKIAAIDSKAFITVTDVFRVYDVHDWKTITDEDKEIERRRLVKSELKYRGIETDSEIEKNLDIKDN